MDSNEYETFQYLQENNTRSDSDEDNIFVIEENGTFITLNKTSFDAQVQNNTDNVETAFNESSEQFYIDVNGTQLMLPDHFVLSNEDENQDNNVFNNNILIQQIPDSQDIQVQNDQIATTSNNINVKMEMDDTDLGCTELTITDEQYKLLQLHGWTLIENNGNILLLDTSGLQDITNNDELIKKLKLKMQDTDNQTSNNTTEIQDIVPFEESYHSNIPETNPTVSENIDLNLKTINDAPALMLSEKEFLESTVNELSEKYENSDPRINGNTIKIKTKFSLKDIPSKIVLGTSVNGKKLVARVTKTEINTQKPEDVEKSNHTEQEKLSITNNKIEDLINQAICERVPTVSDEHCASAARVVQQLLRVPAFKPAVLEKNLIVTKTVVKEDCNQSTTECEPVMITGHVVKKDNDKLEFEYIDNMLQKIRENGDNSKISNEGAEEFLQIHIQEVISSDGISRISITLTRRVILLNQKRTPERPPMKVKKAPRTYACGACAEVFNTEYKLQAHQQLHNVSDNLKTDVVKTENMYRGIIFKDKKIFCCNQCPFKTMKRSIIHRHIKSHFHILLKKQNEKTSEDTEEGKHKCTMCPATYTNASTLSRHFVKEHVQT